MQQEQTDFSKPLKRDKYIDNKEFARAMEEYSMSPASVEYRRLLAIAKETKENYPEPPAFTPYIATCLIKIAEGLAKKPNFFSYSYRDEMVADAIENCCKVLPSYDPQAGTRSGKPNPFGYFTQICYFAFIRRIQKEQHQTNIKEAFIDQAGLADLAETGDDCSSANGSVALEGIKNSRPRRNPFQKKAKIVEPTEPVGLEAFM